MRNLLAAILVAAVVPCVHAQNNSAGGYWGVAFGFLDYKEVEPSLNITISDSTNAFRIFGGYRFNDNLAIEAGWATTGDIKESFSGFDPVFGDTTLEFKGDYDVKTIRVLGILPLEAFSLFGGVGSYYMQT